MDEAVRNCAIQFYAHIIARIAAYRMPHAAFVRQFTALTPRLPRYLLCFQPLEMGRALY